MGLTDGGDQGRACGRVIFQQVDCEIPRTWSQLATNVVSSKYFYGDVASGNGSPSEGKREYSVRQLVDRVTRTIADWGKEDGFYFCDRGGRRSVLRRVDGGSACINMVRSIRRSGSTWACSTDTGSPARPIITDGTRRLAPSPGWRAPTSSRKPRPASSRASATTWKASCGWPRARPCCSSSAPGPAPTSRPSAPATRSSPVAASPRGPSASCGSMMPSPRWSSRGARRAGRRRCRRSSAGTPTSSSSSSARSTKRRRPRR